YVDKLITLHNVAIVFGRRPGERTSIQSDNAPDCAVAPKPALPRTNVVPHQCGGQCIGDPEFQSRFRPCSANWRALEYSGIPVSTEKPLLLPSPGLPRRRRENGCSGCPRPNGFCALGRRPPAPGIAQR